MKKVFLFGFLVITLVVVCVFGIKLFVFDKSAKVVTQDSVNNMPVLKLPIKYFSNDSIVWGEVDPENRSNNKSDWKYAAVGGEDVYQSFPTSTVSFSSDYFSNDNDSLPPIKSLEQIMKSEGAEESRLNLYKQEIKDKGDLATQFLPDEWAVVKKFDIDNDKKDETIALLCETGSNHCPHRAVIIKDGKIIFSIKNVFTNLDINKAETGNGFYVNWIPLAEDWNENGLCCSSGHMKTRFVYENGKFKPAYEQKVLYFKVKNTQ